MQLKHPIPSVLQGGLTVKAEGLRSQATGGNIIYSLSGSGSSRLGALEGSSWIC